MQFLFRFDYFLWYWLWFSDGDCLGRVGLGGDWDLGFSWFFFGLFA
jgi:hypothetical protein